MGHEAVLERLSPARPDHDRIVVVGGGPFTLDLLRLATVRSDDVVLVAPRIDGAIRRFTDRFAVDVRKRAAADADLVGATAVIVAAGDVDVENRIILDARRRAIPVHVWNRPLVSDFTLIGMLERHPSSFVA